MPFEKDKKAQNRMAPVFNLRYQLLIPGGLGEVESNGVTQPSV